MIEKILEWLDKEKKKWTKMSAKNSADRAFINGHDDMLYMTIQAVKQIAAEYNNSWIPVSERFPKENKVVLAYAESLSGDVYIQASIDNGCWFTESGIGLLSYPNGNNFRVLAWQPLPEPYQAEREVFQMPQDEEV